MHFLKETSFESIEYSPMALSALLEEHKVVAVKKYQKEENADMFFHQFSEALGQVICAHEDLNQKNSAGLRWIDIVYDPEFPNRYRNALVRQPLHTDFSPVNIYDNIQFIYCRSRAKYGGATTFIDSRMIAELLLAAGEHQLFEALLDTVIIFSRGGSSKSLPIFRRDGDDYRVNWNYFCVDPQNGEQAMQLVERFHDFLQTRVVPSGLLHELLLEKYDAVIFHDELVLHGRNAFFAKEKGERCLMKCSILLPSRMAKNLHLLHAERG